jgi:hypothetical protein
MACRKRNDPVSMNLHHLDRGRGLRAQHRVFLNTIRIQRFAR